MAAVSNYINPTLMPTGPIITDFGNAGAYIRQNLLDRRNRQEQSYNATSQFYDSLVSADVYSQDYELRDQFVEQFKNDVNELVESKYNGDWGKAAPEVVQYITKARSNPFWNTTKAARQRELQSQAMLDKYNMSGEQMINFAPSDIPSYNIETRQPNQISFGPEKRLDYDSQQEKLFNQITADFWDNPPKIEYIDIKDPKTGISSQIPQLVDSSGQTISQKKIDKYINSAFNRYKDTNEGIQQKRYLTEIEGYSSEEADNYIKEQLRDVGYEKLYSGNRKSYKNLPSDGKDKLPKTTRVQTFDDVFLGKTRPIEKERNELISNIGAFLTDGNVDLNKVDQNIKNKAKAYQANKEYIDKYVYSNPFLGSTAGLYSRSNKSVFNKQSKEFAEAVSDFEKFKSKYSDLYNLGKANGMSDVSIINATYDLEAGKAKRIANSVDYNSSVVDDNFMNRLQPSVEDFLIPIGEDGSMNKKKAISMAKFREKREKASGTTKQDLPITVNPTLGAVIVNDYAGNQYAIETESLPNEAKGTLNAWKMLWDIEYQYNDLNKVTGNSVLLDGKNYITIDASNPLDKKYYYNGVQPVTLEQIDDLMKQVFYNQSYIKNK